MTTIGYATLQIIPSLQGVSNSVTKQLGGFPGLGKKAGQQLGSGIAAGVRASESDVKRAFDNHKKLADRSADATGKLRTAEAQLQELRRSGANDARITAAEEKVFKARRDEIRYVNDTKSAYGQLETVRRSQTGGGAGFLSKYLTEDNARAVGTKVGRTLGLTLKAAAGAGAAGLGYAVFKGFDRLQSIDTAQFKLKALGHSGDETKQIMDNALASVKGTAFGLGDAATAAASAVAAGIKPGEDLTKYLGEVADAAGVAGTSFGDMGSIFNKIQTQNKAYTDDLQQLSDRGLPIFTWLQDEYGVTADKLSDMVQKGQVDSAHFQEAINKNIGGAAKTMGQSFDGAVDNLEASVARVGANFITAILGGDPDNALQGPIDGITRLTDKFDDLGKWVQQNGPKIRAYFTNIVNDLKPIVEKLGDIAGFIGDHPRLIELAVVAFGAFKTIEGIGTLTSTLGALGKGLDSLPGKAKLSAGGISTALAAIAIPAALYEFLNFETQQYHSDQQDRFWRGQQEDDKRRDLGLKPEQPRVGDFGGPPRVGQGNAPQASQQAPVGNELRNKIAAGQLPGYTLAPNGQVLGPDGKPVNLPGLSGGGYTGSMPGARVAGVVHGDEHVIQATSRRSIEAAHPGLLDFMNSTGSVPLPGYEGGGLVKGDQELSDIIKQRFGIATIGGYRPADKYGEHSTGRALDVMVGSDKAKGDAVRDFALANASAIDLKWVIWQQHLFYPGGGGYDMPDRGSPTQNHRDHVHIFSGTGIVNGLRGTLGGGVGAGIASGVQAPVAVGGPGAEDTSSSDQTVVNAGATSSGGGEGVPSSLSGLGSFGLSSLGAGVGTTKSGSDLSVFGQAASSAVTGQISSALGVLGVNDTPGFLKAASTLVGGINVKDSGGNTLFDGSNLFGGTRSATPVSASPLPGVSAATPTDASSVHGARAGQAPGPQTVFNIRTATVEDAFLKAQKMSEERAAAKLSRY